ncbi:MAG: class I SAM-dependent methyltransferase [Planctomycetes bacterium]|nr:class I SAM-dependent methyltransferase [Planctomycetota bacterium]
MEVAEFAQNITFRLLQPNTPRPSGFRALNKVARKAGIHLEMWMTRLPEDQEEMQRRLKRACKLPRTSTFAIGAIINRAVSRMPDQQAYLNIGVGQGFTLFAGMSGNSHKKCIGVDDLARDTKPRNDFLRRYLRLRSPQHRFWEGDFRDYLQHEHEGQLGLYVFDGSKSYDEQRQGLELAEPFFGPGCLVLVDDTNWPEIREANLDFMKHSRFEYRSLLDIQTPRAGHPTFWNGLMLFERGQLKSSAGFALAKNLRIRTQRAAA